MRIPQDLPLVKRLPRFREQALGLEELRRRAEASSAAAIREWELDLQPIMSQNARRAWQTYAEIKLRPDLAPYLGPVVYGHVAPGAPGPVLQYWYLYLYNDAPNKHEGDREMVCLQLDGDEKPLRAGYAGHQGGYRSEWSAVEKDASSPDRPVVYVSRGSHAAYYGHRPAGHRTNSLSVPKNLLPGVQQAIDVLYALVRRLWPFRDSTPASPADPDAAPLLRGQRVDIGKVVVLPQPSEAAPELWWMRLDCRWGSSHARGFGVIGPNPPWQHGKWHDASGWINGLLEDDETRIRGSIET